MKRILTILALTFVYTASANAQFSGNVAATAEIQASITVAQVQALDFGVLAAGATSTIASNVATSGVASVADASTGQTIDVTVTLPANLNDGGVNTIGIDDVTVDADDGAGGVNADPTAANISVTDGDAATDVATFSYTSSANTAHVFIGATVNTTGGLAGVTYNGNIDVTVNYN